MIYRILGYFLFIAVWTLAANASLSATTLARQNLAVNTVNGGDAAYLAQRWAEGAASLPVYWVMIVAMTIVFWLPPALSKYTK